MFGGLPSPETDSAVGEARLLEEFLPLFFYLYLLEHSLFLSVLFQQPLAQLPFHRLFCPVLRVFLQRVVFFPLDHSFMEFTLFCHDTHTLRCFLKEPVISGQFLQFIPG